MKKSLGISIIMILIMGIFTVTSNAASASIYASSKSVDEGSAVSVTVSFGQNVSAAQFKLNYDSSRLQYVSKSTGVFDDVNTKRFSYISTDALEADLPSVTFTFNAKKGGNTTVSVSDLKISTGTQDGISVPMANSSVTITINSLTQPSTNPATTKPQTTVPSTKPTTSVKSTPKTTVKSTTKPGSTQNSNDSGTDEIENIEPAPNELIRLGDTENIITLQSQRNNIIVKGIPTAIENEMILDVSTIDEYDEDYEKIENIMKDVEGKKTYYSLALLKDNEEVEPNGYVTVFIQTPKDCNKELIEVYYVDLENEVYGLQDGEFQKDYYTYTTDHFYKYVLVEKEEPIVEPEVSPEPEKTEQQETRALKEIVKEFFTNLDALYIIIGILLVILILQAIIIKTSHKGNHYKKNKKNEMKKVKE